MDIELDIEKCDHEFDPKTIKWSPKYGRIGLCKKCGKRIYHYTFITKPKRMKPKMKKKARLKLRKKLEENENEKRKT